MDFASRRVEFIKESRAAIAAAIGPDFMITQAVNAISDIDKTANTLAKRLREWIELYNPEFSKQYGDHDKFVAAFIETPPKRSTMGGNVSQEDLDAMTATAALVQSLYAQKETLTDYIKTVMEKFCPHVLALAGPLVGGKLLGQKGTLRELAFMPASTIQLLGAEKALFRHLKTNARTPKYGYLLQHSDVSTAQNKGKAARQLANKISLAAKQDYFSNPNNQ